MGWSMHDSSQTVSCLRTSAPNSNMTPVRLHATMENSSPGIQRLSNELLRDVLDQIEADPEKLVNLDRRAYLSQESFKPPAHPSPDQAQNIASFRLTCRRFSELGAVHQFARITTRFSRNGFRRLDWISRQPELAKHVKKFSYMVPCFYAGGEISFQPCQAVLRILLPPLLHQLQSCIWQSPLRSN